ncbi:MAG: hypothetical protein Q4B10_07935 [Actinomycetaceae bacterium]|nr:hypothetical protein [Actinomycetaceae bacterium]
MMRTFDGGLKISEEALTMCQDTWYIWRHRDAPHVRLTPTEDYLGFVLLLWTGWHGAVSARKVLATAGRGDDVLFYRMVRKLEAAGVLYATRRHSRATLYTWTFPHYERFLEDLDGDLDDEWDYLVNELEDADAWGEEGVDNGR